MGINASKDAGEGTGESIPVKSTTPRDNRSTKSHHQQQQQMQYQMQQQQQQQQLQLQQQQMMIMQQQQSYNPQQSPTTQSSRQIAQSNQSSGGSDELIPTVFKWEHGGKNVYITGSFNNWERNIPMHRSGNDFSYIHNIKKGKHAFKFLVDDEWRYAPDQPTVPDVEGRVNNFIDVCDFKPYIGDYKFFDKSKEQKLSEFEFLQLIPDVDEYTKEPPSLPPHLRHIILNKPSPSIDQLSLSIPQHVSLNHLYCTTIKDGMMVLGATHRYKEKYCTMVFYAMMPSPSV